MRVEGKENDLKVERE